MFGAQLFHPLDPPAVAAHRDIAAGRELASVCRGRSRGGGDCRHSASGFAASHGSHQAVCIDHRDRRIGTGPDHGLIAAFRIDLCRKLQRVQCIQRCRFTVQNDFFGLNRSLFRSGPCLAGVLSTGFDAGFRILRRQLFLFGYRFLLRLRDGLFFALPAFRDRFLLSFLLLLFFRRQRHVLPCRAYYGIHSRVCAAPRFRQSRIRQHGKAERQAEKQRQYDR